MLLVQSFFLSLFKKHNTNYDKNDNQNLAPLHSFINAHKSDLILWTSYARLAHWWMQYDLNGAKRVGIVHRTVDQRKIKWVN